MAPMRIHLPLTVLLAAAALAAAGSAGARTSAAFCKGAQLTGTFAAVPGSAGAGNIVYKLTLRNRSQSTCSLTGLPSAQLLGKTGKRLPTRVRAAFPGALTAILVTLAPGQASHATARFSPDVPGPGEPVSKGACEPKAYALRVALQAGGTTTAKITPATPVCEHGTLSFSAYGR